MAIVRPFRAIRPAEKKAKDIASVPYDVVNTEEAKELAGENVLSFLHVIRPEIDLPDGTDLYADSVYEKAAENFNRLLESGSLIQEQTPSIYLYKLTMGDHEQVGVACCCSVDDYDSNVIKKHEHTRKDKEDDRLRHMLTLSAHAGPVLLTYRGDERINDIVRRETAKPPLYDITAEDGVGHTIWRMEQCDALVNVFKSVASLYIADGHHRAAGASRVKKEMVDKKAPFTGEEEWGYFLAVLFPAEELVILPYNRWICDLGGLGEDDFIEKIEESFDLDAAGEPEPKEKGEFTMYIKGSWYGLTLKNKEGGDSSESPLNPVSKLDLSLFQRKILEPVLGILDQRKDKRIDFVGGEDSAEKLQKLVDDKGGVAFCFHPVSIEDLLRVSDAGMVMPPKSTWFVPKLRSGLLVHRF
ncbi:MAG TPA: DUF1015 domain-containing protein [Spirochaetota bacterium]|nr:DUF1015 domain-containing protein [Spirochaetota bacterium]